MAAGDRTDSIVSQAQFHLASAEQGKLSALVNALPPSFFYDKLNQAQTRLASELLCIEKTTTTLATVSGVAAEPSGFYRAHLLVAPSGEWLQLSEVTVSDYDLLTRNVIGTAEQTPLYYKRWAGSITFWPTPADGNHTMHYYGIPTTTPSTSVDPETPPYMDEMLLWMILKEAAVVMGGLELAAFYERKYANEFSDVMKQWRRTKTVQYSVEPDSYR